MARLRSPMPWMRLKTVGSEMGDDGQLYLKIRVRQIRLHPKRLHWIYGQAIERGWPRWHPRTVLTVLMVAAEKP